VKYPDIRQKVADYKKSLKRKSGRKKLKNWSNWVIKNI